ncbi:MAG TPA: transposase [Hanamia sp.]
MAVKFKHSNTYTMYFCTFTCYDWLHLFEQTNSYDLVYNWFSILKKKSVDVVAYVIMPNHVHCILNFQDENFNLNKIVSNGKRFMAYEIIIVLKQKMNIKY